MGGPPHLLLAGSVTDDGGRYDYRQHTHATITPDRFVEAWSVYDAGLLHAPTPDDRFRPLNFTNRCSAYLAAGLPVALARDETPALQAHLQALNASVVYGGPADLVRRLPDAAAAAGASAAAASVTFEALFPTLISFIESCRA